MNETITKICTKCGVEKELSEYNKQKSNNDGLMYMGRECSIKSKIDFYRTKRGLCLKIYTSQKARCIKKNRPLPEYTSQELEKWILSNDSFETLFYEWEKSGYKKNKTPSVDRIDNSRYYSFDNIRLMTWEDNKQLGHEDMRNGKIIHGTKPHKKVIQFLLDKQTVVNEFVSTREAERNTGIKHSAISRVCEGRKHYNSAGGFYWRYKDE